MPVRTMDKPSWLAPVPISVCVSAVDQALPQMETAEPKPSIVWNLVAVLTVMSAAAAGAVVLVAALPLVQGALCGWAVLLLSFGAVLAVDAAVQLMEVAGLPEAVAVPGNWVEPGGWVETVAVLVVSVIWV
nr:hypothetical protein Ade03nite_61040 [Actinoplanes derwentensis]